MLLPLTDRDVTTSTSRHDYSLIARQHQELPESLEGLFALLGDRGQEGMAIRGTVLLILLWSVQQQAPGWESAQLWLVYAYRLMLKGLACKYHDRSRSEQETLNDVVWCFLETVHSIHKSGRSHDANRTTYLALSLARETANRVRSHYGHRTTMPSPEVIPLEELVAAGWDTEDLVRESVLQDLKLREEDRYILIGQYVYGYNLKELAEQLGIQPAALRQRVSRLMRKISKENS